MVWDVHRIHPTRFTALPVEEGYKEGIIMFELSADLDGTFLLHVTIVLMTNAPLELLHVAQIYNFLTKL